MIIKTVKRNDGKVSRDRKRSKTADKKLKRLQQKIKYSVG